VLRLGQAHRVGCSGRRRRRKPLANKLYCKYCKCISYIRSQKQSNTPLLRASNTGSGVSLKLHNSALCVCQVPRPDSHTLAGLGSPGNTAPRAFVTGLDEGLDECCRCHQACHRAPGNPSSNATEKLHGQLPVNVNKTTRIGLPAQQMLDKTPDMFSPPFAIGHSRDSIGGIEGIAGSVSSRRDATLAVSLRQGQGIKGGLWLPSLIKRDTHLLSPHPPSSPSPAPLDRLAPFRLFSPLFVPVVFTIQSTRPGRRPILPPLNDFNTRA
jgi:hypothetical protein